MAGVLVCERLWFEFMGQSGSKLMAAVAAGSPHLEEIHVRVVSGGGGILVRFTRIGIIHGRQVYEAGSWNPAGTPEPGMLDLPWIAIGPQPDPATGTLPRHVEVV